MILIDKNKNYRFQVISKNSSYIILQINIDLDDYIICLTYWKPPSNLNKQYIRQFNDLLFEFGLLEEQDCKVIILGDFNAHINCLNDQDDEIFIQTNLYGKRFSYDTHNDRRSFKLVELMEKACFVVLNGRSVSDRIANHTYLSTSNESSSVIDLVWINSQCIQTIDDFSVHNFSTFSDHMLCSIDISLPDNTNNPAIPNSSDNSDSLKITRWNDKYRENYFAALSNQIGIYFNSPLTNDLADNFRISILDAMEEAEMSNVISQKNFQLKHIKNSWFNEHCKKAKKDISDNYKILRKNDYNDSDFENLVKSKKLYKELIEKSKKNYEWETLEKLRRVNNSRDFWNIINNFKKPPTFTKNEIPMNTWHSYFENLYHPTPPILIENTDIHPILDVKITLGELQKAINKLKNNKSVIFKIPKNCYFFKVKTLTEKRYEIINLKKIRTTNPDVMTDSIYLFI